MTVTVLAASLFWATLVPAPARAQTTEERFQDLFITAGYCTAFGAALGTAMLAFQSDPADNLKYVAMGASLGFIGGSLLGSYIIFSPGFVSHDGQSSSSLLADGTLDRGHRVAVRPVWNRQQSRVEAVEAGLTLSTF